jgi:hypothetical protein
MSVLRAVLLKRKLRPSVDMKLVIGGDLEGLWGYTENKGNHFLVVVSLKRLQWQPEMVETILRRGMAHVLSRDFLHGEKWRSSCERLGIAAHVSEPAKTLYTSYTRFPSPTEGCNERCWFSPPSTTAVQESDLHWTNLPCLLASGQGGVKSRFGSWQKGLNQLSPSDSR